MSNRLEEATLRHASVSQIASQINPSEKNQTYVLCRSQTGAVMGCSESLKIDRLLSLQKDERY